MDARGSGQKGTGSAALAVAPIPVFLVPLWFVTVHPPNLDLDLEGPTRGPYQERDVAATINVLENLALGNGKLGKAAPQELSR